MKFGDIVVNEWASSENPQKVLLFVRTTRNKVHCLAINGKKMVFYDDKDLKLTHVGTLDLSHWRNRIARQLMGPPEIPILKMPGDQR